MSKVLILDLENKKIEYQSVSRMKKGLYLGYELYDKFCSKDDLVVVRGALSGLLPGACHSYVVYYKPLLKTLSYAIVSGTLGGIIYSSDLEAIVIKGGFPGKSLYSIIIDKEEISFNPSGELAAFDYQQMKNVAEKKAVSPYDVVFFSGNSVSQNIFSNISITGNELLNGDGLGALFLKKNIRMIHISGRETQIPSYLKKEYFTLIKKMKHNVSGVFERTCYGCPNHCFFFRSTMNRLSIKHIIYRKYIEIFNKCFNKEGRENPDRFFYIFDIFSVDFMAIMPVIKYLFSREDLSREMGIRVDNNLQYKDVVLFLKNLNVDNNKFYNLLRSDMDLFKIDYKAEIIRHGNSFAINTEEDDNLVKLDFYHPSIFDTPDLPYMNVLKLKALYEMLGICPNLHYTYDEYWLSKIGEKTHDSFREIDRLELFGNALLNYKYEMEKKHSEKLRKVYPGEEE